ncbi:MAG: shikimate kinase [Micavibrio sp.]|nr:MAG: shikimate kinase [Micavibrio sp.]
MAQNITKNIVLVGLMGAGKTRIGREIAKIFRIPFVDADREIEAAAGCSVQEIFALYGEDGFREGEVRVIERLLQDGPIVLATGGGAFMNETTRANIAKSSVSVWLKADLDLLVERTSRTSHRPLLQNTDPRAVLAALMEKRYPVYALADVAVDCDETLSPRAMGQRVKDAVLEYLADD